MALRTILHEHGADEQIQNLGIGFNRYDDLMAILNETLAEHPDKFPVIKGTRLSICKTNEFAGNSFPGVPSLAIYFHYNALYVHIVAVELNDTESYGTDC